LEGVRPELEREGYCLLGLCTELGRFVGSGRVRKTYLIETDWFLDYILKSLKGIERFVKGVISKPPDAALTKARLRDFGEIRKALFWLYVLTKESIDADSLSIPFSLATFLNQSVNQLEGSDQ